MKTNTQKNRANASELSAFDKKVISLAKKNGLQLQRVRYRYGFNVWRIYYENALDRDFIAAVFSRLRGVDINESRCVSPANYDLFGHFDIMDFEARAEFTAIFDAENAALENWWMRYHAADEKTRETMSASGATSGSVPVPLPTSGNTSKTTGNIADITI